MQSSLQFEDGFKSKNGMKNKLTNSASPHVSIPFQFNISWYADVKRRKHIKPNAGYMQ